MDAPGGVSQTLSWGTRGGSYRSLSRPPWPWGLPAPGLSPWAPAHSPHLVDGSVGSMELPLREHSPGLPRGSQAAGSPWSDEKAGVMISNFTVHLSEV